MLIGDLNTFASRRRRIHASSPHDVLRPSHTTAACFGGSSNWNPIGSVFTCTAPSRSTTSN